MDFHNIFFFLGFSVDYDYGLRSPLFCPGFCGFVFPGFCGCFVVFFYVWDSLQTFGFVNTNSFYNQNNMHFLVNSIYDIYTIILIWDLISH